MQNDVLELLAIRRGHFLLESGHHGELWLDLELLYRRPRRVEPLCSELARRIASLSIDAVCGPLIEGAFVALTVASELNLEYSYAERFARASSDGLFSAGYRIPEALRESVRGKRVAIVNDVINAGSAVRGTAAPGFDVRRREFPAHPWHAPNLWIGRVDLRVSRPAKSKGCMGRWTEFPDESAA